MSDLKNFEKSQALADCTSIEDVVALINGAECPERVAGQYAVEAALDDGSPADATADFLRRRFDVLYERGANFDAEVALQYALEFLEYHHGCRHTAREVIDYIVDDYRAGEEIELQTIVNVLEDGEALSNLGLTDDDQPAIERAHAAVSRLIDMGFVQYSECAQLLDTCYMVEDLKISGHLVIDLHHFIKDEYLCDIEEVTSVDTDEDGSEVEVTRWAVLRWKTGQVNRAQTVGTFEDEDEAMEALSKAREKVAEWYAMDIYNNPQNAPFSTREQAEDFVAQELE